MGCAKSGEHTNGGLDDVAKGHHLAWLRDSCLEDSHLSLLVEQPH